MTTTRYPNFEVHHLGFMQEVGSFGMISRLWGNIFKLFLKVRYEIYFKKKEISWYEVDLCLCENQQLEIDDKFIPIFIWG